jgi:hypothetical protein
LRLLGGLALLSLVTACAGAGTTSLPGVSNTGVSQSSAARAALALPPEAPAIPLALPAPVYTNATPTAKSLPVKVTALPTPAQITIEASVKCGTTTTGSTIMSYINSWVLSAGLCNGATNPNTSAGMKFYDQGSGKQVFPTTGLAGTSTYFVAGVHDGTNLIFYVCAYPKGTCSAKSLADAGKLKYSGTTAYIGTAADGVSRPMSGDIWDLSLYAAALTPAQIQTLANAMRADPYATPTPTPFYTNATPSAKWLPLKVSSLPTPPHITIEASVKCKTTTTGSTIMSYINSWVFSVGLCNGGANPNSSAGMKLYDQGTSKQVFPTTGLVGASTYFVAGVHDGTNLIFYVCAYPKGTCQSTPISDPGKLTYSGTTAYVGAAADGVSRPMTGDLWDLSLYSAALSPTEIQVQANAMRADPYPSPSPNPCGGSGVRQTPSLFTSIDPQTGRIIHVMPPPGRHRSSAPDATANLTCHGGPIQTAPKLYLVFWGAAWGDTSPTGGDPNGMKARTIAWAKTMGGSRWKNTDTQYVDSSGNHVGNDSALFAGEFDDTSSTVPATPSDSDLVNEAARAANHFGDYSVNDNYVLLTPISNKPDGFETAYCAWHSYTNAGGNPVPFTNMPYVADGSFACGSYFVNPAPGGITDGLSIVLGHEQAETETDPLLDAWFDTAGEEIGDKCAWIDLIDNPDAGGFPTQPLWSNATSGCVQSY